MDGLWGWLRLRIVSLCGGTSPKRTNRNVPLVNCIFAKTEMSDKLNPTMHRLQCIADRREREGREGEWVRQRRDETGEIKPGGRRGSRASERYAGVLITKETGAAEMRARTMMQK